jgi:anti-sigma factor RsiW
MDQKRPGPAPDDGADGLTEEIVAFLDGELDAPANEAVGAKISLDPTARAEADALKRAWDLLDYLPRPEPSPNFTERTLSQIAPARPPESPSGPAPARSGGTRAAVLPAIPVRRSPGRRALAAAVWLLVAAAAGFAGYFGRARVVEHMRHLDQQEQDARILSDRRLLRDLPNYRYVDDLAFLQALDSPDLFGDETSPPPEGPK